MSNFKMVQNIETGLGCKWSLVQIQSRRPSLTNQYYSQIHRQIHGFSHDQSCLLFHHISLSFTRLFGDYSGNVRRFVSQIATSKIYLIDILKLNLSLPRLAGLNIMDGIFRSTSMARIRYIKPEFFEDEILAVLPERVQLLYIGLWCHMDRDGVVEYSPAVLKSKIFPHSEIPKDKFIALIEVLVKERRLTKFEYNGKTFLLCSKFREHQLIHKNERPKYKIPKHILESTVLVPYKDGSSTVTNQKELVIGNGELVIGNGEPESGNDGDHIRIFEKRFDQKSLDEIQSILDHVFENKVPPDLKKAKPTILHRYGSVDNFRTCLEDIINNDGADPIKNASKYRNYISVALKKQIGMIQDAS